MMPAWRVYEGYRGRFSMREREPACTILRTWTYVPRPRPQGLMKTWKRIAFDCGALLSAARAGLCLPRQHLIVAVGPPLQAGVGALALKRIWGAPVVFWIQDIVPDAAVEVGMMKDSAALRIARQMEAFVYRGADRIVAISESFQANLLRKGVGPDKLSVIPNWSPYAAEEAREQVAGPRPSSPRFGIPDDAFVVMHTGSIGAKQRLENLVDAVSQLDGAGRVYLVVTGDGNRRAAVEPYAKTVLGERAIFLGTLDAAAFRALLPRADLFLLNQGRGVCESVAPSKLLKYLAAGRPVVAAVHAESEPARMVRESGCGLVVAPEDPAALALAIGELQSAPWRRERMGGAGAEYVRCHFSRANSLGAFSAVAGELLAAKTGLPALAFRSSISRT
jgi:glycosyltransferase involved in cell wall biosynthesis